MRFRGSAVVAALGLLAALGTPSFATMPGGIDVTCDVPRTGTPNFRGSASGQTDVKFKLWSAATGGSQLGSDYSVPTGNLIVAKRYTEKFDSVSSRKAVRISAAIGSDGSPVLLPADGQAWLEVMVGTTTLGCDFAATGNVSARRRLQSAAFARESNHSETCDTCTTATTGGGPVKAWVNFNGVTAAIRGQLNVSSITHGSLGNFVINFTTPMADANYAAHITTSWNGATNQAVYGMIVSQTTSGLTTFINNGTTAYGPYDPAIVSVTILD